MTWWDGLQGRLRVSRPGLPVSFTCFTFLRQYPPRFSLADAGLLSMTPSTSSRTAFYIAVTLLFYYMFKPVNWRLSWVAAFFSLVGCAIEVLRLLNLAPLRINSLAFFGPYCLLLGYLIFRSTFLPRILGVLMAFAGFGWLIFLLPLGNHLSTYLKIVGFVAEASLMLWLLVMGVNLSKRKRKKELGELAERSQPLGNATALTDDPPSAPVIM